MLALLEMRRHRTQFVLIAVVISLISYLVLMINGLGVGLNVQAGSALQNFNASALAYSDRAGLSVIRSELSDDTLRAIASSPRVEESAPLGYVAVNYQRSDGKIKSAAFLGYDPGTIAEPPVVSGRTLTAGDARGVLADRSFLKAAGLKVGDSVDISYRLTSERYTILGEIDEGAFFFQPAVYLLRSTWQTVKYGSDPAAPAASIMLLKGSKLPGSRGDGFEVVDKTTAFANIEGVQGQQSTVQALRWFGYLIGALVIGMFFYVITLQKVPQIGMLKALGASNGFVFRQVLIQAITLSLIGVAISVPAASLTNRALQQLPDAVPIAFAASTYLATCFLLVATSVIGAVFSARRVVGTDPIIALGQQQ